MTQKNAKKDLSKAQKVGLGVGLTAAALAAAGTYFLYGSKAAKENRKKVKSWMLKARGEVLEGLEKAQHITKDEYLALVSSIGNAYATVQNATAGEVKDFKKDMVEHWQQIEKSAAVNKLKRSAGKAAKTVKKAVAKAPAKAAKKAVKKAAKKATS